MTVLMESCDFISVFAESSVGMWKIYRYIQLSLAAIIIVCALTKDEAHVLGICKMLIGLTHSYCKSHAVDTAVIATYLRPVVAQRFMVYCSDWTVECNPHLYNCILFLKAFESLQDNMTMDHVRFISSGLMSKQKTQLV